MKQYMEQLFGSSFTEQTQYKLPEMKDTWKQRFWNKIERVASRYATVRPHCASAEIIVQDVLDNGRIKEFDKNHPDLQKEIRKTIYDSPNKIIKRVPAQSYVLAFLDILYGQIYNGGNQTTNAKTVSGTITTVKYQPMGIDTGSISTTSPRGIFIGTGINAIALTDYSLQTIIVNGNTTGQVMYDNVAHEFPITSGSTRQFDIIRPITNISGASIAMKEIGLFVLTPTSDNWMIDRTLMNLSFADQSAKIFRYRLKVTI